MQDSGIKWLRLYLDFCQKYKFNQAYKESLAHFLNKLREKNQTDQQQEQASDAISMYYETEATQLEEKVLFNYKNVIISTKKSVFRSFWSCKNRWARKTSPFCQCKS